VVFWWQRGRLGWRRDFLPLLPFFLLGAAAGVSTAWVEQEFVGAEGAGFELSIIQRGLIAGRAIWFYLGKLFWPANLTFIYPRWQISEAAWWQYLFPLAQARGNRQRSDRKTQPQARRKPVLPSRLWPKRASG